MPPPTATARTPQRAVLWSRGLSAKLSTRSDQCLRRDAGIFEAGPSFLWSFQHVEARLAALLGISSGQRTLSGSACRFKQHPTPQNYTPESARAFLLTSHGGSVDLLPYPQVEGAKLIQLNNPAKKNALTGISELNLRARKDDG